MACKFYIDNKVLNEQEIKQYIVEKYINKEDIRLTTIEDLANILAYSNSKLILPGYEVEYTTPDNNKFKTYAEASNHISELAKNVEDVDLSGIKITDNVSKGNRDLIKYKFEDLDKLDSFFNNTNGYEYFKDDEGWYIIDENDREFEYFNGYFPKVYLENTKVLYDYNSSKYLEDTDFNETYKLSFDDFVKALYTKNGGDSFIERNKEYEQSKEIIEEWKKENNIQYDPEEVYSRGQGFYSSIGAYSNLELDLLLKNLIQHIEDNKKAGGEFTISAFTKPIDKRLKHIEGTGDRVRFVIYPKSEHIKWAAPTDVYSGSVWDAHEKVSKDKKSELLGVSFTKAPALRNINEVSPNLADIIDNLSHVHNELGIELTTNNFRIEYDDNIDYSTKKLIDNINKILDGKYGKLVKPKITTSQSLTYWVGEQDPGTGEYYKLKTFNSIEEAQNYTNQLSEETGLPADYWQINQQQQGKQPTQTKENTTSIESVKKDIILKDKFKGNKVGNLSEEIYRLINIYINLNEGIEKSKLNKEIIEKKELLESWHKEGIYRAKKEYTSQALTNLKVAALKEVARKYPRSLITSEVKPISSTNQTIFGFGENNTNNNSENQEKSSILDNTLLNEITFEDFKCK